MKSQYLWFGINNVKKKNANSKQHVIYPEIESLLQGAEIEYEWQFHNKAKNIMRKCGKAIRLFCGWEMDIIVLGG